VTAKAKGGVGLGLVRTVLHASFVILGPILAADPTE